MIAVVALWAWIFGSGADLAGVQDDGPWAVLYLANWHFIADSGGYWESFAQPSMFDHLWSLAIEEQFYLLWPIVLVAIWKWSSRPTRTLVILTGIGGGVVVAVDGAAVRRRRTDPGVHGHRHPRGVVAGRCARRDRTRPPLRSSRSWPRLGDAHRDADRRARRLRRMVVGRHRRSELGHVVSRWPAGAFAGVRGDHLVVVALDRGWLVRGFGWRPLVWIGVLSYGLYLWHWPIYTILSAERTGLDGAGAARRAARRFGAGRVRLVPARRRSDPPPGAVGARTFGDGRARRVGRRPARRSCSCCRTRRSRSPSSMPAAIALPAPPPTLPDEPAASRTRRRRPVRPTTPRDRGRGGDRGP